MSRLAGKSLSLPFVLLILTGALSACGGGVIADRGTGTGTGPATIWVHNDSNESIYYIYMSPSSESVWGGDLLGSNVLHTGSTFQLYNVPEGSWDIRVVDSSGDVKEFYGEWVSAGGEYDLVVDAYNWQ